MELTLYSTLGCHLCEEALLVLDSVNQKAHFRLTIIDIAEDDLLIEQYGIRIPVISLPDARELNWPFTEQDILSIISK